MSWNLEGKQVSGKYLGEFPFTGTVTSTRIKYGGKVSNTIKLDNPLVVYGADRDTILMDSDEILVL